MNELLFNNGKYDFRINTYSDATCTLRIQDIPVIPSSDEPNEPKQAAKALPLSMYSDVAGYKVEKEPCKKGQEYQTEGWDIGTCK